MNSEHRSVVIIGAGPSGAIAAALLKRKGHDVLIIERQRFPRFSIGESLLSHCLDFIEEAGMLEAVQAAGFQTKHGAAFGWGERYTEFDFRDKFTAGHSSTYQVQRADFDKLLADQAESQGVEIRYEEEITAADFDGSQKWRDKDILLLKLESDVPAEIATPANIATEAPAVGTKTTI